MNHLGDIHCLTPLGEFHILIQNIDGVDIVRASGFGNAAELQKRLSSPLDNLELRRVIDSHPYALRLQDYFNGHMTALDDIPCMQEGSTFYQRIWHTMRTIHPGRTLTYKQLAKKAGNIAAVRAAGTACGSNKIILIIPCHRIIRSDGGLGGYFYGSDIKKALLAHEARPEKTL